jgi:hypothetical protein
MPRTPDFDVSMPPWNDGVGLYHLLQADIKGLLVFLSAAGVLLPSKPGTHGFPCLPTE